MNARERLQLWNWIREYVVACGGDPSDLRYARKRREEAGARIEQTVGEILERLRTEGPIEPDYDVKVQADPSDPTKVTVTCQVPARWCERGLIDLPENPTVQQDPEARERLRKSLADWMTRGNMQHKDKAEKWPTPMPDGAPLIYFTHEEIEEERAKLRAEAEKRAAEMTPATVEEQVEFVKKAIEIGCGKLILPSALIREAVTGKPGYEGCDPADLVCVHASGSECGCVCHADPPKGLIIHDRACCERCPKCGFRTVLP